MIQFRFNDSLNALELISLYIYSNTLDLISFSYIYIYTHTERLKSAYV
jgi:hypothetical protein